MAEYNGWSNYKTWLANVWLNEGEWAVKENERLAREFWGRARETGCLSRKEKATQGLANALKENLEKNMPELTGLWLDLLRSAFDGVDFDEIAESWLSGFEEEAHVEA